MLRGLVLCGGQSSRMGQDKGLLSSGAECWAAQAVTLLAGVTEEPVVVSVNASQFAVYSGMWSASSPASSMVPVIIADDEALPAGGPLKGVLTVHQAYPDASLLVMACDMPLIQSFVQEYLCRQFYKHPQAEAVVFANGEQVEPLCGIYTADGLCKIAALLRNGKLKKSSMRYVLTMLHTQLIAVPEAMQSGFVNCNTPEQLSLIAGKGSTQS